MKYLKNGFMAVLTMALVLCSCGKDDEDKGFKAGDKEAILLVTFGSSYEAPQETFKTIDAAAKAKFPNMEIRWAYTSDIILNKLRQGNGEGTLNGTIIDNDTPAEALKKLAEEGYGKISVQSLHVIPGEEFDDLIATVNEAKETYKGIECTVGKPLLDSQEDLAAVAQILVNKFKTQLDAGESVLFMGHGTHHENHARYAALEVELQKLAPNFFIGVVDNAPLIGDLLPKVKALNLNTKNITITPLMSIAGDHANNDMNGVTESTDLDEQSWKERLVGEGYTVNSVMKGLGDYSEINAIWMSHLEAVKIK
jgi:sirohydrochlorin cobaltochelatase